jgi:hypothetical protein
MRASQKIPNTLSPSAHLHVPKNTLGKSSSYSRFSVVQVARAVGVFVSNEFGLTQSFGNAVQKAITLSPSARLRVPSYTFGKCSSFSHASVAEMARAADVFVRLVASCSFECGPESRHFEPKRSFARHQQYIWERLQLFPCLYRQNCNSSCCICVKRVRLCTWLLGMRPG